MPNPVTTEKFVSFQSSGGNQPVRPPHSFGDIRRISSDKIMEEESLLRTKVSDPPSFQDWFDGETGSLLPLSDSFQNNSSSFGFSSKIPSWNGTINDSNSGKSLGDNNNSGRSLGNSSTSNKQHSTSPDFIGSDLFHSSPPPLGGEEDLAVEDYGLFTTSNDMLDMQIV